MHALVDADARQPLVEEVGNAGDGGIAAFQLGGHLIGIAGVGNAGNNVAGELGTFLQRIRVGVEQDDLVHALAADHVPGYRPAHQAGSYHCNLHLIPPCRGASIGPARIAHKMNEERS